MQVEDTIELVESASYAGSVDSKTPKKRSKNGVSKVFKPNNRIGSPPDNRTIILEASGTSKIEEIVEMFEIKPHRSQDIAKSHSSVQTTKSSESDENVYFRKQRKSTAISETTDSVFSLKSDGKSYREKLRERFHTIKENTEKSLTKAQETKAKGRKTDLENLRNTLGKENQAVEAELRSYEHKKPINQADAYNFFCHEFRNESGGVEDDIAVDRQDEGDVRRNSGSPVEKSVPLLLDLQEAENELFQWLYSG